MASDHLFLHNCPLLSSSQRMVSYLEYSYRVTFVKALKVAIVATHAMREAAAHCFPCQQWVHDGLHAV